MHLEYNIQNNIEKMGDFEIKEIGQMKDITGNLNNEMTQVLNIWLQIIDSQILMPDNTSIQIYLRARFLIATAIYEIKHGQQISRIFADSQNLVIFNSAFKSGNTLYLNCKKCVIYIV
jgi:hypothetical protein